MSGKVDRLVGLKASATDILANFAARRIDEATARNGIVGLLEEAIGNNLSIGLKPDLERYAGDLLARIKADEIEDLTAAADVGEMLERAFANDPDFRSLLELGPE